MIAERYERVATLLTSNLDFPEWGEAFLGNKMIGAATLDRLRHGAYKIILDGESYRAPMALGQPQPGAKKSISKAIPTASCGTEFVMRTYVFIENHKR